jgi:hypothetical protein
MTFKAKVEHAAAVTKWKADQQIRIVKANKEISDMENQIKERIYILGETTMALADQGNVSQPELQSQLKDLVEMRKYFFQLQSNLEAIKNEAPPPPPVEPAPNIAQPYPVAQGLVCPQCGRPIVGKFCPEHGLEGVAPVPASPQMPSPMPEPQTYPEMPANPEFTEVPVVPPATPEPATPVVPEMPDLPPAPPLPPMPDLTEIEALEGEAPDGEDKPGNDEDGWVTA